MESIFAGSISFSPIFNLFGIVFFDSSSSASFCAFSSASFLALAFCAFSSASFLALAFCAFSSASFLALV